MLLLPAATPQQQPHFLGYRGGGDPGVWGGGVIPAILGYGGVWYWGIGGVGICLVCWRVFPYSPVPLRSIGGSLNQSRQQSIALCKLLSLSLGFFDLFIKELVEGSDQLLRWTLLDDGPDFLGKTN